MLKNRRSRVLLAAVLGVIGSAGISRFASADPTWFTAVDTHAEDAGPLDLDDAGVIRHGVSEAGNIGLRLLVSGTDTPAVYTRSTNSLTLISGVTAGTTDNPVRSMSSNGLAAGYYKPAAANVAFVFNPGAAIGSPPNGYPAGPSFTNIASINANTAGIGRANGINGLGRVIGDGSTASLYFPEDTPLPEFTTQHLAGTRISGAAFGLSNNPNSINDRTEISSAIGFPAAPAGYTNRVPAFQVWYPNAQQSRWVNSDTGTGTVTSELANTIYFPDTVVKIAGMAASNGRDIANSGDVAGYGPNPANGASSAFDRGFVYRRSSRTFAFTTPLAGDTTSELIGVNNGAIAVGVSDIDAPFSGLKPNRAIIFNQSFGSTPVDLNKVTAAIPAGFKIFNAFGISSYNGDGLHTFYIAAYATNGATPETGTIIKALLLKSSMGDFVGGGNGVNAADINTLNANMGGVADTYDLTGDAVVDSHDRDMLVEGVLNSEYGDANLDNVIDSSDFTALSANFNASGAGWAQGDFNGDGIVNALDFNAIASNFGFDNRPPTVPALGQTALGAVVPEPSSVAAMVVFGAMFIRRRASQSPRIKIDRE